MAPRIQPKQVIQRRGQVTAMLHQKQQALQFLRAKYYQKEIMCTSYYCSERKQLPISKIHDLHTISFLSSSLCSNHKTLQYLLNLLHNKHRCLFAILNSWTLMEVCALV